MFARLGFFRLVAVLSDVGDSRKHHDHHCSDSPWCFEGGIFIAISNTAEAGICIAAFFLIPEAYREHAFTYLFAYSGLVLLFYFINYNMGVRYIDLYDPEKKEYYQQKPFIIPIHTPPFGTAPSSLSPPPLAARVHFSTQVPGPT